MDFGAIEKKWQKIWQEQRAHTFDFANLEAKNKYYIMSMLPYPSGANLHVGHWYNYSQTDSFARYKKMQGFSVFQPMGFDSFGLPAENYAIKTGVHPKDSTEKNIETMRRQLSEMGAMFDWDNSVVTSAPEYYKWTQWLFLQFFKAGLVYKKEAQVNWCGSCNTVISNEQVVDGECERCGTTVVRKNMQQWFFKITDYAEELLSCLDALDWPEKTKLMQKNWIGKSTGGEIEFSSESGIKIPVYTTRADTLFGVSFLAVAPESPLVSKLTTKENAHAVKEYCENAAKLNDIERLSTQKEKTGVFSGSYVINPINNEKVPVFIADYVLYSYGTGAVMGVPSHDSRDYVFAKKYNLKIRRVILSPDGNNTDADLPFCEYGTMINSGKFDGLSSEEGRIKVVESLAKSGKGALKTNYRLRDWSVSRQRFWGCPIPIIICDTCGDVAVPEQDLPVKLPYDVDFKPSGQSPLKSHPDYLDVRCPVCGKKAHREADTLDTFVCSSWYFLRYADAHNHAQAFAPDRINKMLPVDKYVGGAEHACMHLLYARFFTKALRDIGLLKFDEPFVSLVHQGIILGPDGQKMSKSLGNVINPDKYINEYGSDVFRLYMMFGFSFVVGGPWSDDGIKAVSRFVERIERLTEKSASITDSAKFTRSAELDYALNYCVKQIRADIENFQFNTCIARIMELVNALYKYDAIDNKDPAYMKSVVKELIKIIAPFAPHASEELWQTLGETGSVFSQRYPECNERKLVKESVEYAIQLNSKVRLRKSFSTSLTIKEIENQIRADKDVLEILDGAEIKKLIVIEKRLINILI